MADKTINDLTEATSVSSNDLFEIENTGNNSRKVKASNVRSFMAGWVLAGTGQTATGVYDFAVDGAKANIDFIGLASFNELLIVCRNLTNGTSGVRQVQVSVDNGSSFYTASGDYVTITTAGVEAASTALAFHATAATAARSLVAQLSNTKGTEKFCQYNGTLPQSLFVASASDINAIRVSNSGGGNMTGGTVRVYGR